MYQASNQASNQSSNQSSKQEGRFHCCPLMVGLTKAPPNKCLDKELNFKEEYFVNT